MDAVKRIKKRLQDRRRFAPYVDGNLLRMTPWDEYPPRRLASELDRPVRWIGPKPPPMSPDYARPLDEWTDTTVPVPPWRAAW